jgi:electron transport complex protein RnfA
MSAGLFIKGLVSIFLTGILTENYILSKFLGICPFLGVSKKLNTAVGMSAAVIFVMILATAVTWPIYTFILAPLGFEYLETVTFILIIAFLVQLVETIMKKFMPPLYNALGIYLPLITTNCAVLGVTMLVIDKTLESPESFGFIQSLVSAFGSGVGFMVAMVLFAGIRQKMETCNIPKFLQGLPITLVAASLLAVSFLGFQGMVDGMLG